MKTNFTKGKWIASFYGERNHGETKIFRTSDLKFIADAGGNGLNIADIEEREANAKLIAAAPDLLKALIEITECYKLAVDDPDTIETAEIAIKKATK